METTTITPEAIPVLDGSHKEKVDKEQLIQQMLLEERNASRLNMG
ncbi:MAG: hypothetical protein R3A12_18830 [Ignavibacteria bacterium]